VASSSYFPPSEGALVPAHNETVEFEDGQEVQQEQDRAAAPADLPRARQEDMHAAAPNGMVLRIWFLVALVRMIVGAGPARIAAPPAPPGPEPQDDGPIDDIADEGGDQGDALEAGEEDLDGLLEGAHGRESFFLWRSS